MPSIFLDKLAEVLYGTGSLFFLIFVYLERLHAVWDGEGGALILQVHRLLLCCLLSLLFQHGLTNLQQQGLKNEAYLKDFLIFKLGQRE